jgi:putative ABC transport system substrate-binding protein
MKRRDFITLFGSAAIAWPLAARAQQPATPVIGLLSSRSPAVDTLPIAVIRQGLNESGLVEGQNVALDYRWADGQYDRLTALAADLVRRQAAVIVTIGGDVSALAAKAASATIPIVFAAGADPLRGGLVTNLHRPGGNITGVSTLMFDLEPKRLGLVRELRPNATTIAVLVDPNSPNAEMQVNDIQATTRSVGGKVEPCHFRAGRTACRCAAEARLCVRFLSAQNRTHALQRASLSFARASPPDRSGSSTACAPRRSPNSVDKA